MFCDTSEPIQWPQRGASLMPIRPVPQPISSTVSFVVTLACSTMSPAVASPERAYSSGSALPATEMRALTIEPDTSLSSHTPP